MFSDVSFWQTPTATQIVISVASLLAILLNILQQKFTNTKVTNIEKHAEDTKKDMVLVKTQTDGIATKLTEVALKAVETVGTVASSNSGNGGIPGPQGEQGVQGLQGVQGEKGK